MSLLCSATVLAVHNVKTVLVFGLTHYDFGTLHDTHVSYPCCCFNWSNNMAEGDPLRCRERPPSPPETKKPKEKTTRGETSCRPKHIKLDNIKPPPIGIHLSNHLCGLHPTTSRQEPGVIHLHNVLKGHQTKHSDAELKQVKPNFHQQRVTRAEEMELWTTATVHLTWVRNQTMVSFLSHW